MEQLPLALCTLFGLTVGMLLGFALGYWRGCADTPSSFDKAQLDALIHGLGVTRDGKHVPVGELYQTPSGSKE